MGECRRENNKTEYRRVRLVFVQSQSVPIIFIIPTVVQQKLKFDVINHMEIPTHFLHLIIFAESVRSLFNLVGDTI